MTKNQIHRTLFLAGVLSASFASAFAARGVAAPRPQALSQPVVAKVGAAMTASGSPLLPAPYPPTNPQPTKPPTMMASGSPLLPAPYPPTNPQPTKPPTMMASGSPLLPAPYPPTNPQPTKPPTVTPMA